MAGSDAGRAQRLGCRAAGGQAFPPASCPRPPHPPPPAPTPSDSPAVLTCPLTGGLASPRHAHPRSFHSPKRSQALVPGPSQLPAFGLGATGGHGQKGGGTSSSYSPFSLPGTSLLLPGSLLPPALEPTPDGSFATYQLCHHEQVTLPQLPRQ